MPQCGNIGSLPYTTATMRNFNTAVARHCFECLDVFGIMQDCDISAFGRLKAGIADLDRSITDTTYQQTEGKAAYPRDDDSEPCC